MSIGMVTVPREMLQALIDTCERTTDLDAVYNDKINPAYSMQWKEVYKWADSGRRGSRSKYSGSEMLRRFKAKYKKKLTNEAKV